MRCIADMTAGMDGPMGFCVGQAVKYLWRSGTKPGESELDDKGKARWYLDWIAARKAPVLPVILLDLAKLTLGDKTAQEIRPILLQLAETTAHEHVVRLLPGTRP